MLIVGSLFVDKAEYVVYWVKNKIRQEILIFNTVSDLDLENIENNLPLKQGKLNINLLNEKTIYSFADYLQGGLILKNNNDIEKICGTAVMIRGFLDCYRRLTNKNWKPENIIKHVTSKLNNAVYMNDADDKLEEERDVTGQLLKLSFRERKSSITFVTERSNPNVSKISSKDFKGIEWQVDDLFSSEDRDKLKMLGAKRLSQLRTEKDLSWYFNKDGSIKKNYKVLHTIDDVIEVTKILDKASIIAVDTETEGLNVYALSESNPIKSRIVGMSISWNLNQGIYIPFRHTEFENVPIIEALDLLKPYLETMNIICHNGIFDGKVFLDNGIKLHVMQDTMIMNFIRNPTESKGHNGLKELTKELIGSDTLELDDIFNRKSDAGLFKYLTEDLVRIYACADTDFTLQLYFILKDKLAEALKRPYQLDVEVERELISSEYYGNKIDMTLLNQLNDFNDKDLAVLEKEMYKFIGKVGSLTLLKLEHDNLIKKGELTREKSEEILEEWQRQPKFQNASYEFNIGSNKELDKILYSVLNYPVLRVSKSGNNSVDKFAIEDLSKIMSNEKGNYYEEDIMSSTYRTAFEDDDTKVLINANEFNSMQYPFVYLLGKWRKLEKLKTAFFTPLLQGNLEERFYAPFKMCNAETGRIINRVQTLIGQLKKLIVPFSSDYYLCVFDFAQIEYRVVAGLSENEKLVNVLRNPRADYHREGGASFYKTEPYKITHDQRKKLKVINFAKLYKMSDNSLCEALFGRIYDEKVKKKKMEETVELSVRWEGANYKLRGYLEGYVKFALQNGYVKNPYGRRRYFNLADMTPSKKGKIERMAGNYPIQSFAAELFKLAFVKFRRRVRKEGLEDKVFTQMLIHDEMVNVVHKSVNPYYLYSIIMEEVMLELKGHPRYYAGISICDNWYEGKDDLYEAPIEFVIDKVKEFKEGKHNKTEWCDNPKDKVITDIKDYMKKVYFKELYALQPDLTADRFNLEELMPKFTDYFLKPRITLYVPGYRKPDKVYKPDGKVDKDKSMEEKVYASIERVFMDMWGVDKLVVKYPDKDWVTVTKDNVIKSSVVSDEDIHLTDLKDDELVFDDLDFDDTDFEDETNESRIIRMSIPNREYFKNKSVDGDKIIERNLGNFKGNSFVLLDKEDTQRTFKEDDRICLEHEDMIYLDVTDVSKVNFNNLCKYLADLHCDDGAIIVFTINSNRAETKLKVDVDKLDYSIISKITNKSFISLKM